LIQSFSRCIYATKPLKGFFEGDYKALTKPGKITAPAVDAEESTGTIFPDWKAPEDGFTKCTDTLVYEKNVKIKYLTSHQSYMFTFLSNYLSYYPNQY